MSTTDSGYVHNFVAARKAAFCKTNPGTKPSENHITTWADMAIEQFARENGGRPPGGPPPSLTDTEHDLVEARLAAATADPRAAHVVPPTPASNRPPPAPPASKESGK